MKRISKRIGKTGIAVGIVLLLSVTLVGATLLQYFGKVETTANVQQSVVIDGHNWDVPVTHTLEAMGGCCYCYGHTIENRGCKGIDLQFNNYGCPNLKGIDVIVGKPAILTKLEISHLDGIADDSFNVYIDDELVYEYQNGGDTETWYTETIDLTQFDIMSCGTHTIKIEALGEPWKYFETYGQLAIDWIKLYRQSASQWEMLCDEVDIGDVTSESTHNPIGWGPIEPDTHGGNWGGIAPGTCRVVWFDQDETWATVDLTCVCPQCGQETDDCDLCIPIEQPFHLDAKSSMFICVCYKFDMLIMPGTYTITSKLVPVVE